MRMHTIPQNVTAYEDKIVGMLVGRQFIYLAVAGVIIFILLSTNIGPIFIRGFLSLLIGGFAAALALFKPNDRNFDGLMMSYAQAIFGPTEWVWRKDEAPLEKLHLITDQLAGRPPTTTLETSSHTSRPGRDNLLRVSRFQTFISERESGIDNEELEFIEQLNFSEPVPQKAFEAVNSIEKAPPMLTRQNYAQFKLNPSPTPPPLPLRNSPKPLSPIAGYSGQLGATFAVEGRQQGVRLRSNLRTNRSLSRQLLSSGVLALPVRGERTLDLSDDLKEELLEITSYLQQSSAQKVPSTKLVSGEPKAVTQTPVVTPKPITAPTPPTTTTPIPSQEVVKDTERIRRFSDYDNSSSPSLSQQISMLSQALPNSGITKGSSMSDLTPPNQPTSTADSPSTPPQPSQVRVVPNRPVQAGVTETDLEREARQIEAEAQKAISQLEQTGSAANPAIHTTPATPSNLPGHDHELVSRYETEVNRLKAHSQEMEQKAIQAEVALQQLQQQVPGQSLPPIGAQPEMVDLLHPQPAGPTSDRPEFEQKPPAEGSQPHIHAEYAPVPGVTPVIPEETHEAPALDEPVAATPITAQIPTPPAPQPNADELDLQAKMAAAGVGTAEATAISTPAPTDAFTNTAVNQQSTIALTNQPNIINGSVVDAQGQLVAGVIVVVKNAQGESKRALKTNKLGQFVVTTPLANGAYSVEVDKKGLSFDIMKVKLTGAVLPPILIKSKSG